MSNNAASVDAGGAPAGPRWGRRLGLAAGVLLALLLIVYFVATSGAFIKGVVLPRAGAAVNARITADDVSLSPFSQLEVRNLKVLTTGEEPFFQAELVRVRYSLMAIIRGNIQVPEITVTAPQVTLVQKADGTSNLDPLLAKPAKPAAPAKPSAAPPKLTLGQFDLTRGAVRFVKTGKDGSIMRTEVRDLAFGVSNVGNGQAGKLKLAAAITQTMQQTGAVNQIAVKVDGALDFALTDALMPASLKGDIRTTLSDGLGAFKDLSGLTATLSSDVAGNNLKQLQVAFSRSNQALGRLSVTGPFDPAKGEARLTVELDGIDRQVLGLVGAARGMDFTTTRISASNVIDLGQKAQTLGAQGKLTVQRFSVATATAPATPPIDATLDYQFTANLADQSAAIHKFEFLAKQGGSELLSSKLNRPTTVAWGTHAQNIHEAEVALALRNLRLQDWKAFTGTNVLGGAISAQGRINLQQDGKLVALDLSVNGDDLGVAWSTNSLRALAFNTQLKGRVEDFNDISLDSLQFELRAGKDRLLTSKGSAGYNKRTENVRLQLDSQADLVAIQQRVPFPGLRLSSGRLDCSLLVQLEKNLPTVTVRALLAGLTGQMSSTQFKDLQVQADTMVEYNQPKLTVRQGGLTCRQGSDSGGQIDFGGSFDTATKTGQFVFNGVDVNQVAVGPFLAPALAPNRLASMNLGFKGSAKIGARNEIELGASLTKLVLAGPAFTNAQPLGLQVDLGLVQAGARIELPRCTVTLTPTNLAANVVDMKALIDLGTNQPAPSTLTVKSEGLDLTPWFDLAMGLGSAPKPAETTAAKPAADPAGEPPALTLPLQQFTGDFDFKRLYVREIAITNWTARASLQKGDFALKPCDLLLNGAPVKLALTANLNQPGYRYGLELGATQVPLEPIANTFAPDNRGQVQGELNATAAIRGAGITAPNLKRNLGGQAVFAATNMNLQVVNPKYRKLVQPVATLLRAPELLETVLNYAGGSVIITNGAIQLHPVTLATPAFIAGLDGEIKLADVLTNSTLNLPVQLALRRSIAEKIRMVPANTPANAAFVSLPQFAKVAGTMGVPETQTDKVKLGSLALGAIGQAVGGDAGKILQSVGGSGTNAPADALGGLLRNVLPPPKAATNAPGTNAPAATNAPANALGDLLRNVLPPPKK